MQRNALKWMAGWLAWGVAWSAYSLWRIADGASLLSAGTNLFTVAVAFFMAGYFYWMSVTRRLFDEYQRALEASRLANEALRALLRTVSQPTPKDNDDDQDQALFPTRH